MKITRRFVFAGLALATLLVSAYGLLNRAYAGEPQANLTPPFEAAAAQPMSQAELEANYLPGGGRLFAQTTVAEMQAFDAANPDTEQREMPKGMAPDLDTDKASDRSGDGQRVDAGAHPVVPPQKEPLIDAPPLVTNFAGTMDDGTSIPPDTHGAVGPNHVVVMLNSGFAVFTRAGAVVIPQIALRSIYFSLGIGAGQPANRPFDPKILYDQYASRWVMVTDSNGNGRPNSYVLVGMSQTNDPTGAWNLFAIRADVGPHPANNHWADFPGFGLDPNNVIITNNIFTAAGGFVHADVWVIEKAKLTAAVPAPLVGGTDYSLFHDPDAGVQDAVRGIPGFTFQPCHTFGQTAGNARNYLVVSRYNDAANTKRYFRVKRIIGTGAAAFLDSRGGNDYVEVQNYSYTVANATQPGGCSALDTQNDVRLLNAVLRNDSLWTTHHIGNLNAPNMSEVGWYKLGTTMVGPKATPPMAVLQGKIMSTNKAYFYPSIAVDRFDCALLGFSGSDPGAFASAFYTVRPGVQSVSSLKGGLARYNRFNGTDNRWGDYSMACVDPTDDQTMWTLQEYAEVETGAGGCALGTGKWGTWWAATRCGIAVCLTCLGDVNGDSKVDGKDIKAFLDCRLGVSPANACGCADLDRDGDVDVDDQTLFAILLVLPNPGC